jgi:hypothetical protein
LFHFDFNPIKKERNRTMKKSIIFLAIIAVCMISSPVLAESDWCPDWGPWGTWEAQTFGGVSQQQGAFVTEGGTHIFGQNTLKETASSVTGSGPGEAQLTNWSDSSQWMGHSPTTGAQQWDCTGHTIFMKRP